MLFRAEALRHAGEDHTEGRVLLRSPAILWGATLACLACTSAIVALLGTARYTPQARLQGRMLGPSSAELLVPAEALDLLRPGTRIALRLPAPIPGRVQATVQHMAHTGTHARRVLMLKVDPHPSLRLDAAIEADLALPEVRLRDWIWRKSAAPAGSE